VNKPFAPVSDGLVLPLPTEVEVLEAVLARIPPEFRPDRKWAEEFVRGVPGRSLRDGAMAPV